MESRVVRLDFVGHWNSIGFEHKMRGEDCKGKKMRNYEIYSCWWEHWNDTTRLRSQFCCNPHFVHGVTEDFLTPSSAQPTLHMVHSAHWHYTCVWFDLHHTEDFTLKFTRLYKKWGWGSVLQLPSLLINVREVELIHCHFAYLQISDEQSHFF